MLRSRMGTNPSMSRGILLPSFVLQILLLLSTTTTTSHAAQEPDLDTGREAANLHSFHQYALMPDGVFTDTLAITNAETAVAAGVSMESRMDMYMEMEVSVSDGEDEGTTVMDIATQAIKVELRADGETYDYDSINPDASTVGEDETEMFDFLSNATTHLVVKDEDGQILDYEFAIEGVIYDGEDLPLDDEAADSKLGVDITSKLWNVIPDRDVAPGETWEVTLEMGAYFLGALTGTSTLKGYFEYQSQYDVAVFYTEGTLAVDEERLDALFNTSQLSGIFESESVSVKDNHIAYNSTFYLDPFAKIIRYSQVNQEYTLVIDLGPEMDAIGGPLEMPTFETITSTSALKDMTEGGEDEPNGSWSEGSDAEIPGSSNEGEPAMPEPVEAPVVAPTEEAPTEEAPTEEAPTEEAPTEEEPIGEPTEEEPAGEPTEEEPVGEPTEEALAPAGSPIESPALSPVMSPVEESEESSEESSEEEEDIPMIGGGESPTSTKAEDSEGKSGGGGGNSTIIMLAVAGIVGVVGFIILRRRRNAKSAHTMIPQDLNFELT